VAVHIYTQTIHRTTQITTNVEECGPGPVFASFTLAFASQLTKKHGKTSVRLRKTSVTVQYTYYQKHPHITKQHTAGLAKFNPQDGHITGSELGCGPHR
jgi:hypothetical protein